MLQDLTMFIKGFENFGIAALIVWCLYKLANQWAPQFLQAQQETSKAMMALAEAVKVSTEEQRETLIAVRVLSRDMGDVKGYLRDLAERA